MSRFSLPLLLAALVAPPAWPGAPAAGASVQEREGEEEKKEEEKPAPPIQLDKGQEKKLEKSINSLYYARKRVRCSYCDGKAFLVCSKCKGQGKIYKYYPNTGKVDWDKTKNCGKCMTEGKIDCTRRSCRTGFEEKGLRKIYWEMRSPRYREELEKTLGLGDLYVTGFLRAVSILNKDPKAVTEIGLTEISEEIGVNYGVLLDFTSDRAAYKDFVAPFSNFKILELGPVSKVRVRELKNGKVVREFTEISEWVESDGHWYLDKIRRG